jgi:hypothetical protein
MQHHAQLLAARVGQREKPPRSGMHPAIVPIASRSSSPEVPVALRVSMQNIFIKRNLPCASFWEQCRSHPGLSETV